MNDEVLFAGAALMIILGLAFDQPSSASVGLGLMCVLLSRITKSK